MSEFSWAYIDADALISASGPTGSVQFRVGDAGGRSAISGSEKFMFHTASSTLRITGSVEISGTLTANQFNVNYIDKTVTNISASGDTKFGDTPDDIHQFTGSVFVSSSLVVNTGPPGADVNGVTTTTIDGTHISSSLNISGSGLYVTSADLTGDLNVGRFIYHAGDEDTKIEFTTDDIAISAGGREFIKMTEASTDTIEFNRINATNFKFIVNNSENEMLTIDDNSLVINEGGAPDDFRVESNQKQRAFYIDGDTQFVNILVDDDHVPHRTGSDTAVFISGTIGSRGTVIRGTSVFGGDVVISGSLHGGQGAGGTLPLDIGSDGLIVSGTAREATTTINGTHVSSSLNISGSAFYGNGADLSNIAKGSHTQIQFNELGALNGSDNLRFVSNQVRITGSLVVTGSAVKTGTTIDDTHISSSLDISGSNFHVGRFIRHAEDSDTYIDFTADDINIQAGGVNFIDITQDSTNEITFNEEGADIDFRVEGSSDTHLLFTNGGTNKVGIGVVPDHKLTVNGDISASVNISGSAFYGSGANLTSIPAAAIDAAGADNQIQFNDDGDLAASANLTLRGTDLVLTGSLHLTGSGQSLIVLETQDADTLKEIVFNKSGSAAAAIQINSAEHLFIENENAKDIILRANNQNALRVIGSERKVIVGAVTRTTAHAELDVEGSAAISGTFAVSGSSTIGFDADDQSTFGGGLTASLGISLGGNSFVASDKNILFGSAGNSAIQYNNSAAQLIISGSSGANGGINFQGNNIQFDVANGTVPSGSLAGAGSYLGLNSNGRLILTSSAGGGGTPADPDESIQFNNGGAFGGSAAFKFDSARSELELNGSMEVVSGSGAAERTVFQIDSTLTPGESGSVRGRMVQTIVSQFNLTSGGQSATGRYVALNGAGSVSNTLDTSNALLTPFSGRLISITYHFPGANQDPTNGAMSWLLFVGNVNDLNGSSIDSAANATSFCTASYPGTNHVGGVNVQTGMGTLGGANTTGSWAFGTGSAVGLRFKSGDGTSAMVPGSAIVTTVWEFDQLDPYISGSGN